MDTSYIITVVAIAILSRSLTIAGDLEQIKQDDLDPTNNEENIGIVKDHSKRTIFSPSHNAAWAKHVAVKPNGARHLIGYSPVDFRYTAVLKPVIRHPGYRYEKPKIQFHLKKPGGWKPVRPVGLPVNVPPPASKPIHFDHFHTTGAGHLDVIHNRPVPHVDHIHTRPEHIHIDHIHQVPVQQVAIAPQPVAARPPIPQPLPVPIVPQAVPAHPPVLHQPTHVLPPSPFFEVTKPDLGVLPFGAVFQTHVLREVPAPQLRPLLPAPSVPIAPAAPAIPLPPAVPVAPPIPVHTPAFPLPQPAPAVPVAPVQPALPVAPGPPGVAVPSHLYPPGTTVEYHGGTNFVNLLNNQVPVLPQVPVNAAHPILPNHFHLQYPQIPQHAQTPVEHQEPHYYNPHIHQVGQPHFQEAVHPHQHLPNGQIDFQEAGHNIYQQNVPQPHFQEAVHPHQHLPNGQIDFQEAGHNIYQQNVPTSDTSHFQEDAGQNGYQHNHQQPEQNHQLHYSPADQVSTQQIYFNLPPEYQGHHNVQEQGYQYPQPGGVIQPGQTDLQLPLHLPHHPGFEGTNRELQVNNDSGFKPSIQLEPPFKKK